MGYDVTFSTSLNAKYVLSFEVFGFFIILGFVKKAQLLADLLDFQADP